MFPLLSSEQVCLTLISGLGKRYAVYLAPGGCTAGKTLSGICKSSQIPSLASTPRFLLIPQTQSPCFLLSNTLNCQIKGVLQCHGTVVLGMHFPLSTTY